ncbi:MAG: hypothetical protein ACYC1U_06885 [Candidatus Aquicultorales bacterium]
MARYVKIGDLAIDGTDYELLDGSEFNIGTRVKTSEVATGDAGAEVLDEETGNTEHTLKLAVNGSSKIDASVKFGALQRQLREAGAIVQAKETPDADLFETTLAFSNTNNRLSRPFYIQENRLTTEVILETRPYWRDVSRPDNLIKNPTLSIDHSKDGKADAWTFEQAELVAYHGINLGQRIDFSTVFGGAPYARFYEKMAIGAALPISFRIETSADFVTAPEDGLLYVSYWWEDSAHVMIGGVTNAASRHDHDWTETKVEDLTPPVGAAYFVLRVGASGSYIWGWIEARDAVVMQESTLRPEIYISAPGWGTKTEPYATVQLPADLEIIGDGDVDGELRLFMASLVDTKKLLVGRKSGDVVEAFRGTYQAEDYLGPYGAIEVVAGAFGASGKAVGYTPALADTWYKVVQLNTTTRDIDVPNGGFETAGGGGLDIFANWLENRSGAGEIYRETVGAPEGTAFCRYGYTSNGTCDIRSDKLLIADYRLDHEIVLLNKYITAVLDEFVVLIYYYNASDALIGMSPEVVIPGIGQSSDWIEQTITIGGAYSDNELKLRAGTTKIEVYLMGANNHPSAASFCMDNVRLREKVAAGTVALRGDYLVVARGKTNEPTPADLRVRSVVSIGSGFNAVATDEVAAEQAAWHNLVLGTVRIPPAEMLEDLPVLLDIEIKSKAVTPAKSWIDVITLVPVDEGFIRLENSANFSGVMGLDSEKDIVLRYPTWRTDAENMTGKTTGESPRVAPAKTKLVILDGGEAARSVDFWIEEQKSRFVIFR